MKNYKTAILYSRIKPSNLKFLKTYTKKKGVYSVSEMIDSIISKYRNQTLSTKRK